MPPRRRPETHIHERERERDERDERSLRDHIYDRASAQFEVQPDFHQIEGRVESVEQGVYQELELIDFAAEAQQGLGEAENQQIGLRPEASASERRACRHCTWMLIGSLVGAVLSSGTLSLIYWAFLREDDEESEPDDVADGVPEEIAELRDEIVKAWRELPEDAFWAAMSAFVEAQEPPPSWELQSYLVRFLKDHLATQELTGLDLNQARREIGQRVGRDPDVDSVYKAIAAIDGSRYEKLTVLEELISRYMERSTPEEATEEDSQ